MLAVSKTEPAPDVARPLKVERTYQELKRLIITGRLAPGSHIDERLLMSMLDAGRTPLREAVLRLAHERLIVHSPRRGAWVSELSLTDLQQMLEARLLIEPLVTRRAAERVTPRDIAALADLLQAGYMAVERGDNDELVNIDIRFHAQIAQCSGNEYFASFSQQVNVSMLRYWHLSGRNAKTMPTWQDNHQLLLSAISSGDPDLADEQARRHVVGLKELLRDLIF